MARLVSISRQMARSWARRCRWQGWYPYPGRWPTVELDAADGKAGIHISADGPQLGKTLQMARLATYSCRWPAVGLDAADGKTGIHISADSPAGTASSRRSRWGCAPNPPDGSLTHPVSRMAEWMRLGRFQPGRLRPRRPDYRARLNPARSLPAGVWQQAPGAATRVSSLHMIWVQFPLCMPIATASLLGTAPWNRARQRAALRPSRQRGGRCRHFRSRVLCSASGCGTTRGRTCREPLLAC
jgi:hypothetical protein